MRKNIKIWLGIIILVICFLFLMRSLFINWHKVSIQELKFNWLFFLIAYIIWFFAFLLMGFLWDITVECIGEELSFIQALRIVSLSMLPKYLPGKVWGILGQVWLTKKEAGIAGEKVGTGVVLSMAMDLLSGALLGVIILPTALKHQGSINLYPLYIIIPVLFVMLHPPIFIKTVNWGIKKLKRKGIDFVLSYIQLLKLLGFYIIFWVSQCIAVFFLIRSFYSISTTFLIPLCGIIPAAWVIGFISFITPGGLGVREGILSYFFSFYMPTSIGIIASIIIRIWATIGEVAVFAIFAKSIKKYI